MTYHDGEQSTNHRKRCSLTEDELGQHHAEDWLQRLHSVRQTDSHCCKRQVSGHMTNGVHGGGAGNRLELSLGDGLQISAGMQLDEVLLEMCHEVEDSSKSKDNQVLQKLQPCWQQLMLHSNHDCPVNTKVC